MKNWLSILSVSLACTGSAANAPESDGYGASSGGVMSEPATEPTKTGSKKVEPGIKAVRCPARPYMHQHDRDSKAAICERVGRDIGACETEELEDPCQWTTESIKNALVYERECNAREISAAELRRMATCIKALPVPDSDLFRPLTCAEKMPCLGRDYTPAAWELEEIERWRRNPKLWDLRRRLPGVSTRP